MVTPNEARELSKKGARQAKRRHAKALQMQEAAKDREKKLLLDEAMKYWPKIDQKITEAAKLGANQITESFWEDRARAQALQAVAHEKGWETEYDESEKMPGDGGPLYIVYITIKW